MTKNTLDFTHRKHREACGKPVLVFAILTILILAIGLVSAIDFGDTTAYWSFDEGSGVSVSDSSGNGYDLSGINTPGWGAGILDDAADLDSASSEYWENATAGTGTALAVGFPFSISGWFKAETMVASGHIIRHDLDDSSNRYLMRVVAPSSLLIRTEDGDITVPGIVAGEWYFITLTLNSSDKYVYVNGVFNQSNSGAFSAGASPPRGFSMGNQLGSTNYFNGLIDEFGIWSKVLTESEVVELYNGGAGLPFASAELDVTLLSPTDTFSSGDKDFNFTAMANATNFNLTNATFNVWFSNSTLFNTTFVNITGDGNVTSNITVQDINSFEIGNYVWNVLFCGVNATSTFCTEAGSNFTLQIGAEILSNTFNNSVYETQSTTFDTKITLIAGANLFAARLNYNGTSYLATKSEINSTSFAITRTIDIPILDTEVTQNLTFFWEFEYRNGFAGSQNSSTFTHEVNPLIFTVCNVTHSAQFWNFTVYNETSREIINNTLEGAFNYWLGGGTVIKDYALESFVSPTTREFCANLNDTIINISAVINVEATGFFERTFYFNKEKITNETTDISLFLQDAGTAVIVEVTDPGLIAVVGSYINVYRFYPEINEYLIIERAKTDEFGEIVARLIEPNTIKYQFEFLDSARNILKRTDDMTIACRNAFCVIPFVIEDDAKDFDRFQNIDGFDFTLSFSNVTNRFTYTWNDVTGSVSTYTLTVERIEFNGTSVVCNITSTSSSSSLICDVGSDNHQYRTQAYRSASPNQRIAILSVEIGDTAGIFGIEGLFWAFILLFTLIGVGSFNPSVGVGLYTVGFIALGVLGIISANIPIYFANLVLGVIFIWAIRS